ncbi:MAG: DUF1109 family protein [Myxococcales bacterium]|nr:MAG: DUF1109 family protein [Myxococcales bacterium]
MQPPPELRARVLRDARSEVAPTRQRVRRRERSAQLLALAAPLVIFVAFDGARLSPRPLPLVVVTTGSALLVALLALWLGLSRGRSTVGRARRLLVLTLALTPLSLFVLKVAASSVWAGMSRRFPERPGFRCFYLSCACLAVPLACTFWALRGTVIAQAALRGAAAGAALGAAVWVLVDLNCPVAYVPHLLLGHVLPLLLAALAGASLGESVLALRRR